MAHYLLNPNCILYFCIYKGRNPHLVDTVHLHHQCFKVKSAPNIRTVSKTNVPADIAIISTQTAVEKSKHIIKAIKIHIFHLNFIHNIKNSQNISNSFN